MKIKRNPEAGYVQSPFTVLVDSREKRPFVFTGLRQAGMPLYVPTRRTGLKTGDYSIHGMEEGIVVERKSIADFIGTVNATRLPDFRRRWASTTFCFPRPHFHRRCAHSSATSFIEPR